MKSDFTVGRMADESGEVRALRELLAQMPDIAADADVGALENDVDRLTLNDWAARTIAAARAAGRQDVVERVQAILHRLDEVDARAAEATQRRRDATAHAEQVLREIDES